MFSLVKSDDKAKSTGAAVNVVARVKLLNPSSYATRTRTRWFHRELSKTGE